MEPAAIHNPKIETETGNDSNLIEYENLLDQTISIICDDILKALLLSQTMKWNEFMATHVDPKVDALDEIDDRTHQFFQSILVSLEAGITANAHLNFLLSFFTTISKDSDLSDKLGFGFGFPHVKKLISNLDAIDPSIVNDVIAA